MRLEDIYCNIILAMMAVASLSAGALMEYTALTVIGVVELGAALALLPWKELKRW